jgi:hypothetical protein
MTDLKPYILSIRWHDGATEIVSDHTSLQGAASEAFRLADELSLPESPRHASEVIVVQDEKLQLSVAISPGQPLTDPFE